MKLLKILFKYLSPAPILLTISFILSQYLHNIDELFLMELVGPLLAAIILSLFFLALFIFLMKDRIRGAIFNCFLVWLFFCYEEVVYLLGKKYPLPIDWNYLVFPAWLAILIFLFFLIKKTKKNLLSLNKFLLVTAIFAVLIPLLGIVEYESQRLSQVKVKSPLTLPGTDQADLKYGLPDIYYIIPDSYTSEAVFEKYMNYNQTAFIRSLEKKGFYVPPQSTSNYPKTPLSLASTLNMEYLDYLSEYKDSADQTIIRPLINDNNVKRFLAGFGYKYYQMGGWWVTNSNPLADRNFMPRGTIASFSPFSYLILQATMLNPFLTILPPGQIVGNSYVDVKNRNDYQFETLPEIARLPGPKFIFAHILSPHLPYIYGKNCETVIKAETAKKTDEENYTDQANCLSIKLEEVIDRIISNSAKPPVILIQSDEGTPFIRYRLRPKNDWRKASDEQLKEKFPIFSAYYLPGVSTSTLYSSISSVNSFRVILNQYFSLKLPLLPDKNYIFSNKKSLYEFIDVTEKVR